MKKNKPEIWWCIESGFGLLVWTASYEKNHAIVKLENHYGKKLRTLRKEQDYKAVKIEVRRHK